MSNPAKTVQSLSNYAQRMNRLSKRIFGEVVRPVDNKSLKVVKMFSEKPLDLRPEVVEYYPDHVNVANLMKELRAFGLYRDEHQDFHEEMNRLRQLRGKGPGQSFLDKLARIKKREQERKQEEEREKESEESDD